MRKRYNRRIWLFTAGVFMFALITHATPADNSTVTETPKLPQNIPDAVSNLLLWPSSSVMEGKRLSHDLIEVAYPKKQCREWLYKVIDSSWLPDKKPEPILIKNEFDDRDVVRFRWLKNGYDIEVSQTASIFVMKLTPQDGHSMGKDDKEKLNMAKELCLQVFAKQGRRWAGQGNTIAISNLAQKIASYSFREDTIQNLQGDNIILSGRPRTMKEESIDKTQNETQGQIENASNSEWEMTKRAWRYWFRNVYWRNDGKCLSIFFPKVEDDVSSDVGIGVPGWGGQNDKNWFRLPKDRSGKTIPVK